MRFGVPSAEAYAWLAAGRERGSPATPGPVLDLPLLSSWDSVEFLAHNDFEPVVAMRFPEIQGALQFLRSPMWDGSPNFEVVLLSGSGSSIFALENRNSGCDDELFIFECSAQPAVQYLNTMTSSQVEPVVVSD